jgi:YgiT-type zinc finger domain-containing protein
LGGGFFVKGGAMPCCICTVGELTNRAVDFEFNRDGQRVRIREVPAEVCDCCGEQYFDDEVLDQLLILAEKESTVFEKTKLEVLSIAM